MQKIEAHSESVIRDLAKQGLPVEQIAFMMRVSPNIVREVLAASANPPSYDQAADHGKPEAR